VKGCACVAKGTKEKARRGLAVAKLKANRLAPSYRHKVKVQVGDGGRRFVFDEECLANSRNQLMQKQAYRHLPACAQVEQKAYSANGQQCIAGEGES